MLWVCCELLRLPDAKEEESGMITRVMQTLTEVYRIRLAFIYAICTVIKSNKGENVTAWLLAAELHCCHFL